VTTGSFQKMKFQRMLSGDEIREVTIVSVPEAEAASLGMQTF
jgi:hypothetical protein